MPRQTKHTHAQGRDSDLATGGLVRLSRDYTQISVSEATRSEAIKAAYWVTASPHEWVWTPDQQAAMARYVLWASQRIEAMQHIASGKPLLHEPNTDSATNSI